MVCGRCEKRHYCGIIHQKQDWPIHQKYCRSFVDPPARKPYMIVQMPLTLAQRSKYTKMFIDELMDSIARSSYPRKELEGVWGLRSESLPVISSYPGYVGVDYPTSALVYNAWCNIFKLGKSGYTVQFRTELKAALMSGGLPNYFEFNATAIKARCDYCAELERRDFKGIDWDVCMLHILAGRLHTGEE